MQIFYFLTINETFGILGQAASNSKNDIGLSFRRFTDSGFDAGFEVCAWGEDLSNKYINGGYRQIYLTTNNSIPRNPLDWDFLDREQENIIIIEGGRINGNELEQSYLRVLSKKSNCKVLCQDIKDLIKSQSSQGLYNSGSFYKNTFYSVAAAKYAMVSAFGDSVYTNIVTPL